MHIRQNISEKLNNLEVSSVPQPLTTTKKNNGHSRSRRSFLKKSTVMEMLFGEFGTFGDGLETRMVILVQKTRSQLSQRPTAAAKPNRWENAHAPAPYVLVAAAK
ncbi:hypothetical protein DY000_02042382 [Brassica cretica]|uniref:Uncharacterized protein n=1 Tax=Brassica cretica TaxID=69181 RepID=A0ABQ7BMH2_BRACR|nr:hypothetical protein DY000_02042382 [Brassica cretica]